MRAVMDSTSGIHVNANTDKPDIRIEVKTDAVNVVEKVEEKDPTVKEWAKEETKPTYTAEEVGALPANTFIPQKVSELENDLGFITEHNPVDSELSDESENAVQNKVVKEALDGLQTAVNELDADLDSKAPLESPALTGTPTAPTQGISDNSTRLATTAFVTAKVNDAMSAGIDYQVVSTLPNPGAKGIIYLVPNGGSGLNQYDEYIYDPELESYEKIGSTEVDLTPYMTEDEAEDITTSEIDAMWEGTYERT